MVAPVRDRAVHRARFRRELCHGLRGRLRDGVHAATRVEADRPSRPPGLQHRKPVMRLLSTPIAPARAVAAHPAIRRRVSFERARRAAAGGMKAAGSTRKCAASLPMFALLMPRVPLRIIDAIGWYPITRSRTVTLIL